MVRQEIRDVNNPKTDKNITGIDIGYSNIKVVSESKIAKIPSYIKKIDNKYKFMSDLKDSDIYYKDESGVWAVGLAAYRLKVFDTSDTDEDILVSRNRTFSYEYKVQMNVALGIAIGANPKKEVVIQTGLPCSYIKQDAQGLREELAGLHEFELRVGNNDWQRFSFEISPDNIKIMEQPFGSFFSISFDKDGNFVDNSNLNVLIVDGGFKTLDIAQINESVSGKSITFDNLGMLHVYQLASDMIYKDTGADVSVFSFDDALAKGVYKHRNRRTKESISIDVKRYYDIALKMTAESIFEKLFNSYDGFNGVDTVILTGGTCDACKDLLIPEFKKADVNVKMSNSNDPTMELGYSNARGYYLYRRSVEAN